MVCKSKVRDIFLGILYGYKAVMQIVALILAFTTRKVKVKGLNDALYIAVAIYITSLLWAVVIVSTYSLAEYLNIFTTVFCFGLFVGTSAIMSLVFIPKVSTIFMQLFDVYIAGIKCIIMHFCCNVVDVDDSSVQGSTR